MPTENSLLSPEDIEREEQFKARREKLSQLLNELQYIPTPAQFTKRRSDGFEYADFSYMLDMMNKFHPLREEIVDLRVETIVVVAVARVKDIMTGEIRTGTDAHRITFRKGGSKTLEDVVDLGNDYKSASQEALRNAYSRYGVCADLYKRVIKKPVTKEQQKRFYTILTDFSEMMSRVQDPEKRTNADNWVSKWTEAFKLEAEATADNFIEQFREKFNILKEKLNEQ